MGDKKYSKEVLKLSTDLAYHRGFVAGTKASEPKLDNPLFPSTAVTLKNIEKVYQRASTDLEAFEKLVDFEKELLYNPMLHLAEQMYLDNEKMAVDLAKYILLIHETRTNNDD